MMITRLGGMNHLQAREIIKHTLGKFQSCVYFPVSLGLSCEVISHTLEESESDGL